MEFVKLFNLPLHAAIIDIGDSHFVEALPDKSYCNIYILDISTNAIEKASKVHRIVSDVTSLNHTYNLIFLHDRTAFHFLTTEDKIYKYIFIADDAIML